jgi:hypothetical protein
VGSVTAFRLATSASPQQLRTTFRDAFFGKPGIKDLVTTFGTARRQTTWEDVRVADADTAVRLINTTNAVTRSLDQKGRGPGAGYVIALNIDSAQSSPATNAIIYLAEYTRGTFGGAEQSGQLKIWAKGIATLLERQGFSAAINVV